MAMIITGNSSRDRGQSSSNELANICDRYGTSRFSPADFITQLNQNGIKSPADLVSRFCSSENMIGEGKNANIFLIPGIENYALRVPKRLSKVAFDRGTTEVLDPLPDLNLGQPVLKINSSFLIKRVNNALPFKVTREGLELYGKVSREQPGLTVAGQEIKDEALFYLCKVISMANQEGLFIDHQNPGNVLYNRSTGLFIPIDLRQRGLNPSQSGAATFNTSLEIASLLCGGQRNTLQATPDTLWLAKRVEKAAKKAGLAPGN